MVTNDSGVYEIKEFQKSKFQFQKIKNITSDKPHTILFEDNEGLIWGSYDAVSIRIYDPKKNYNLVKELPINGIVTGFWHQPNSSIVWMSSQNGLFKIDKNTWQSKLYTEANGLPSRTINAMLADEKFHLWLGTSKGLAQFDPSVEKAEAYNLVDGLSDLNFNLYAAAKAPDGTMYFGTSNGITTFHPRNITPLSISARPTITNILINDQAAKRLVCAKTGATNVSEIDNLELPFSENTVSFTFSAMEYSDPMRCQFQYKMVGVDKDWVEAGTQNFTRYASLKAGTYTFFLKASNSDGVWNEKPKVLILTIVPPFYRTWWFLTLLTLALIALAWYSYRLYWRRKLHIVQLELDKVIARSEERQRIASDMHDDIGSDLSALNYKIERIRQKVSGDKKTMAELDNLVDASRDIAKKVREVIWTINARHDSLSSIINYFDTYAEEFFEPTLMVVRTSIPSNLPDVLISGESRKVLLMCFKETLNNVLKHAKADDLSIAFTTDNQTLTVSIQDNGVGFDPVLLTHGTADGNGLLNLQERMAGIGGKCVIETSGHGTLVVLSLPI